MASVELASAWVQIVPSLKGATKQIQSELSGVDVSPVGSKLGAELSSGVAKGLNFQTIAAGFQSVGGKISSVGDSLTSKITKPAAIAGGAVATLVGALGFKRLVGIDTARGQFKGLGHDADAVMAQVDKGVTNTALSMAEGASLAVGILATGNVPLEDLEAQLKRVANVSAAYGVDSAQAGYLLNNVLTKNKVTYGDLSQMVQNQIPIISDLAKYYGVTGDEIEGMAQRGEISIEDLNKVLDTNAGAAAEEYAKTWKGVTSNILSNIGRIGAGILEDVFPDMQAQAGKFLDFLRSDDMKAVAADIGAFVSDAFSRVSEAIKGVIGWWNGLSPATQKAIGVTAGIVIALGPVLKIVGAVATGIGTMITVGAKLVPIIKAGAAVFKVLNVVMMANPIGLIVTAIAALVAGLVWFFTQTEIGQKIWGEFTRFIREAWENVSQWVIDALTNIGQFFVDTWSNVKDGVVSIWEGIKSFFQNAIKFVLDLFFNFHPLGILIKNWEPIVQFVKDLWVRVTGWVRDGIDNVRDRIKAGVDFVKRAWEVGWQLVRTAFENVWRAILSSAVDFATSVRDRFTKVTDFVKGIPDKIMGFFRNIGTWLLDSGRSLIQGFLDGIKQGFQKAKDFVADGLSSIRNLFPFSPAKEGPFSGRGWVLYSGLSLGETFTTAVADALHDGRSDVADELDGMRDEFDAFNQSGFTVRSAVPGGSGAAASQGGPAVFKIYDTDDRLMGSFRGVVDGAGLSSVAAFAASV